MISRALSSRRARLFATVLLAATGRRRRTTPSWPRSTTSSPATSRSGASSSTAGRRCASRRRASSAASAGQKSFELAAAWILDAGSREVVWNLKDRRPVERRRDLRTVRREAAPRRRRLRGLLRRPIRPTATATGRRLVGERGALDGADVRLGRAPRTTEEAIGDLELAVRGDGRPLDGEDVEGSRDRAARGGRWCRLAAEDDRLVAAIAGSPRPADGAAESTPSASSPTTAATTTAGSSTPRPGRRCGPSPGRAPRTPGAPRRTASAYDERQPAGGQVRRLLRHRRLALAGALERPAAPRPGLLGPDPVAKDPQQRRYARSFEYRHLPGDEQVIVELTRCATTSHRSQGFTLTAPMDGAGLRRRRGARARDERLRLDRRRPHPPEGVDDGRSSAPSTPAARKKNRVADEVIRLEAGSYIVGFVTDGSHAYRDWNSGPPTYPGALGHHRSSAARASTARGRRVPRGRRPRRPGAYRPGAQRQPPAARVHPRPRRRGLGLRPRRGHRRRDVRLRLARGRRAAGSSGR